MAETAYRNRHGAVFPTNSGKNTRRRDWPEDCLRHCMFGIGKRLVYVLRSDVDPERHYVGVTSDADNRLQWHNHGPCGHTAEHRPWSLVVVIELPTEEQALRFERYLKSGSGRAFAKRHFGPHLASAH